MKCSCVCPNTFTEAVVTFQYDAQQDNELTLKVGQVLKNVHFIDEGWAKGELLGKVGMFPANFVELRKAFLATRPFAPIPREDCPPPPVAKEGLHKLCAHTRTVQLVVMTEQVSNSSV